MKKLFIVIAILLFATSSFAAPFLVSDPQTGVVGYEITGSIAATYVAQPDGSLKYDLASAPMGENTVNIAACNVWGCSSTVPFQFSKQAPSAPAGLRIVAD